MERPPRGLVRVRDAQVHNQLALCAANVVIRCIRGSARKQRCCAKQCRDWAQPHEDAPALCVWWWKGGRLGVPAVRVQRRCRCVHMHRCTLVPAGASAPAPAPPHRAAPVLKFLRASAWQSSHKRLNASRIRAILKGWGAFWQQAIQNDEAVLYSAIATCWGGSWHLYGDLCRVRRLNDLRMQLLGEKAACVGR